MTVCLLYTTLNMNSQKQIRYYSEPNGKAPFAEWLDDLNDRVTRLRIKRRLERMQVDKSTQKKDIINAKRYLAELRGI